MVSRSFSLLSLVLMLVIGISACQSNKEKEKATSQSFPTVKQVQSSQGDVAHATLSAGTKAMANTLHSRS